MATGWASGRSQSSLLVGHELRHVEDVGRGELLLHLVQFVGTHGVEVAPIELLLEQLRVVKVVQVLGHAAEVVLEQAVVLSVLEVCILRQHRLEVFLGEHGLNRVLNVFAEVF